VTQTPLLDSIHWPHELRQLGRHQLPQMADELRQFILQSVSRTGGHLSSNLGTIELTLALHYLFNTPQDKIIWDVGHQSYAHKILTGRREQMNTLRKRNGLSGFPKRAESPYDAFGTAHSSTSISAALGMSVAFERHKLPHRAIAIIGDGALTGGMAFEAMNNAAQTGANLLVILNDNEMSISKPVGALNNHLARVLSGEMYNTVRRGGDKILGFTPTLRDWAKRWEEQMKGLVSPPSTLFEALGFNYIGPIDGHDLNTLLPTLENIKKLPGPQFLHILTRKGYGYGPAETDPILYHGVSPFDPQKDLIRAQPKPSNPTFTQVFEQWLLHSASQSPRLMAITPAMCEGSGLLPFSQQYPECYFDVGIAEQHALTFAAGLACEGMKPVVAIYSTFLQRGYDQLIHDIALQNLDVLLAIDRAGLVGADGATHAGSFDISFMRCLPNMLIMVPADENECYHMLTLGLDHPGPAAVRYPRGKGIGAPITHQLDNLQIGQGEIRQAGKKIALLCFGPILYQALSAGENLEATVVNMRFVKPLDESLIQHIAQNHELIVTLEENVISGGAGSAVREFLSRTALNPHCLHLGLPDHFIDQGEPEELMALCGLNSSGIEQSIRDYLSRLDPLSPP